MVGRRCHFSSREEDLGGALGSPSLALGMMEHRHPGRGWGGASARFPQAGRTLEGQVSGNEEVRGSPQSRALRERGRT